MQVKRSGFVYSLYLKNIRNLWILAGVFLLIFGSMLYKSHNYLANYLFYRAQPDQGGLTAFAARDMLDVDTVCADIEAHGGEMALNRGPTLMFFKDNVYQEGPRYRFSLTIDPAALTDTGIYYDDTYRAYTGVTDPAALKELVPRENYVTEHLYLYRLDGIDYLLPMDYETDFPADYLAGGGEPETLRVTFAPAGIYSLYMLKDLWEAGEHIQVSNYMIDGRGTPVDFEDDDFKDLVMVFPFVLLTLIPAILLTVFPALHPTYRQLDKFARSIQKAADQVDKNYEEYGILSEDKKTWCLEDWIIRRSWMKNGIEKNYKKQTL